MQDWPRLFILDALKTKYSQTVEKKHLEMLVLCTLKLQVLIKST